MATTTTTHSTKDAYEVIGGSDEEEAVGHTEAESLIPKSDTTASHSPNIQKVIVLKNGRQHGINNFESMLHILKGNIGTGILAMPVALLYAGLWVGFLGIGFIGIIAVHCMHLLVRSSERLCDRHRVEKIDYSECVELAVLSTTQKEKLSKAAKQTINVFLCVTQFGFCIVYILFIATNIKQFIEHYTGADLNVRVYQTVVLVLLIPFCWIKSLKVLAPFSMVANLLTGIGLVIILQYCAREVPPYWEYPAYGDISTLPLYFGIVIYAFEGISLVLPVENKMKHPDEFRGLTGVLNTAMVVVTVLYMAMGFFGYLKFGSRVEGSITLNMPLDNWLYLLLKLMFALAIFISYLVQFYVPAIILIPAIEERLHFSPRMAWIVHYGLRTLFVIGTFLCSILVPHLELMISLIGALASSALALIFPPIIDTLIRWPRDLGKYRWRLVKNVAISLFGFFGFVTGTVTSLINIVKAFSGEE